MIRYILHFIVFCFLTILTQVGGVAYLVFFSVKRKLSFGRFRSIGLFLLIYLAVSILVVPLAGIISNRKPLPFTGKLEPLTLWTVILNRHYVTKELRYVAVDVANKMAIKFPGTATNYLDANFPFWEGFPLIPHLSHNDGKKLDLAFYYLKDNQQSNSTPSFIGYGAYESPKPDESNFPEICEEQGFWQYGLLGKLIPSSDVHQIDQVRTRFALVIISANPKVGKIFIEPHLKERWELSDNDKIRFHGCQAVRHDDHIHFQIK